MIFVIRVGVARAGRAGVVARGDAAGGGAARGRGVIWRPLLQLRQFVDERDALLDAASLSILAGCFQWNNRLSIEATQDLRLTSAAHQE